MSGTEVHRKSYNCSVSTHLYGLALFYNLLNNDIHMHWFSELLYDNCTPHTLCQYRTNTLVQLYTTHVVNNHKMVHRISNLTDNRVQ